MTIDEAIEKYETLANDFEQDTVEWGKLLGKVKLSKVDRKTVLAECERCTKSFEEYRQLAKWLRELKSYWSEEAYTMDMSMQEWLDRRGEE